MSFQLCSKKRIEESEGVKHHLVGILEPHEEYTVHNFVQCAENAIKKIVESNKIPIIAGGTFYYTESLIFNSFCNKNALKNLILSNTNTDTNIKTRKKNLKHDQKILEISQSNSLENSVDKSNNTKNQHEIHDNHNNHKNNQNENNLWNKLNEIDPIMANFYHKNDTRRIQRSIDIFYQTGKLHSTHIKETGGKFGNAINITNGETNELKSDDDSKYENNIINKQSNKQSNMRYDCIILWLDANIDRIDYRINKRLTVMEDSGIFEEIDEFYNMLCDKYNFDILNQEKENEKTKNKNKKKKKEINNVKIIDNEKGQYISIAHGFGFQSFLPWLKAKYKTVMF